MNEATHLKLAKCPGLRGRGGAKGISLVYSSSSIVQCVQQAAEWKQSVLSCLVADKAKLPNQVLFGINGKALWSSQDGGGGGQEGLLEEEDIEE